MEPLLLTMTGGFALGLASTLHCAGMCGAVSASLLHLGPSRTWGENLRVAALTHAGRIFSYTLAGAFIGAVGAPAVAWLDREIAFRLLQWAGAVALMWIGLSTAGLLPPLSALDRLLAPIATLLARPTRPGRHLYSAAVVGGLAWGLMPCAMVYGALFTAMLTGSALGGASVMTAFGVGTLPGLFASALGVRALARAGSRPHLRRAAGVAICILGFLTVWVPHRDASVICAPGERASLTWIKTGR